MTIQLLQNAIINNRQKLIFTARNDNKEDQRWKLETTRTAKQGSACFVVQISYLNRSATALETGNLLGSIPPDATVGFGDSETVYQIGLPGALHDRGQKLISIFWEDDPRTYVLPGAKKALQVGRDALLADYFIAGINAITLDGKIVNTDSFGNRVAGTIFGPGKVILVAGTNKIVTNVEEAIERILKVAAPLNARRHHLEHGMDVGLPCASTGECVECDPCPAFCFTLIIEHQLWPRLEVVLIGEELGL